MQHRISGAVKEVAQPANISQPRAGVRPCRFEQQMVWLIFTKHVINQVSRKSNLPPGLALARVLTFDEAADDRNLAECAFEQITSLDPIDEFVGQNVGRKQGRGVGYRFQAPHAQSVIAGDKAHRHQPPAFHPPCQ